MKIGVFALQGAFEEHIKMLRSLGVDAFEIREKSDLNNNPSGLVFPGGESTVQGMLLHKTGLFEPIKEMIKNHIPTFGTCAGMILLAKKISNDERTHLSLMDIEVKRNAYGRQLGSFYINEHFDGIGSFGMTFIRAPYIESYGKRVKILAKVNGNCVAAREDNMLVTSFHPELGFDTRIHEYFINMIN